MTTPMDTKPLQNIADEYANDIVQRLREKENIHTIMSDFQSLFITNNYQGIDVLDTTTVIATVTVENTHYWVEVLVINKSTNESKQHSAYVSK